MRKLFSLLLTGLFTFNVLGAGLDSNTDYLAHYNAVDGSIAFSDTGDTGHIFTIISGTSMSATKKFGSASIDFVDGVDDSLSAPDSADWDLIASNVDSWTVSFFVKMADHTGLEILVTQAEDDDNRWLIYHDDGNGLQLYCTTGGGIIIQTPFGGEITDTDWHWVVLAKVADEYAFYLDGTQVSYLQDNSTDLYGAILRLGDGGVGGSAYDGLMDDLIIDNSNIYGANPVGGLTDTITVPTSKATASGTTNLVMNFDSVDVSGDGGSGIYQVTEFEGSIVTDSGNTKFGNTLLCGGTDADYTTSPDSAQFDVVKDGTDYSIDGWVKHDDHVGTEVYITQDEDNANYWTLYHENGSGLQFYVETGNTPVIQTPFGGEITDTDWHHVLWFKTGTIHSVYLDGAQISYLNDPSTDDFVGALEVGGMSTLSVSFDGNLDEWRIQEGNYFSLTPDVGLSDSFVIPTAEYSFVASGSSGVPPYIIFVTTE